MPSSQPSIRVIIRLPYNRPEEPFPDPPRVEWNSEKEHILWEVIAKSRVVEGAGTDWKGLASHLQVPLPYLLYRAQARYEEDLRGLRDALSSTTTSPSTQALAPTTSNSPPTKGLSIPGEYFYGATNTDKVAFPQKNAIRSGSGHLATSITGKPLPIRTRLNSLGQAYRSLSTPQKVSSSSTLTLQGPKKTLTYLRPLSPTYSRAESPSSIPSNDAISDDESDDEHRKEEEQMRRAEEQEALDRKLKELTRMMTKDALGLVSSPTRATREKGKAKEIDRGRARPLSSSGSSSLQQSLHHRLSMSRRYSTSHTPSHHSLSSMSSPQGSIPDIPSPPSESIRSQSSPMARHLSPANKSTSPPAVSHGSAWGTVRHGTVARPYAASRVRSDKGSEFGSEVESFSDLSEGSLSTSALESALMSGVRGGSSRFSSFSRSSMPARRNTTNR